MKTYKILIVEDDETITSSVEKRLTCWGYETKCVQDFSKVLDTLQNKGYIRMKYKCIQVVKRTEMMQEYLL